ncbi:MAG TPA: transposase [Candidatus Paceibacterota bacterium]
MRLIRIAPGEYYHVCNRGLGKQVIFHENRDYLRFLFLILYFQSTEVFQNIGRLIEDFVQHRVLNIAQDVIQKRTVELVAFCIMPNHFHLLLKEVEEGGISAYMQRILNAYGKYYNTKHERSGHVFQGPYRAVHIESDVQLMHASAYIHRNPVEIIKLKGRYEQYLWSSYDDIVGDNRWGDLIQPDILLGEFKDKAQYQEFVRTSPAKLYKEEIKLLNV